MRADAGIVPEPTAFDVWIACRGSVYPTITVEGRPGHAELRQPHWRDGGAVNAIEKAQIVLDAIGRLREEWRTRADLQHPYLSPPDIVPTLMRAGEWSVTYPASCEITSAVLFPPALADADGYGSRVRGGGAGVDRARLRGRSLARRAPAALRVDGRHPADGDPAGRPDRADGARRERGRRASRRA